MNIDERKLRGALALSEDNVGRKNYSVRAGAGGGKTTMLSKRICKQIAEGTPASEFVIITYTNAAAEELREKISEGLRIMANISNIGKLEKKRILTALGQIELMQISTIHAFLLKLLREYAFEAGIVIDAGMLEETDEIERKARFFDRWYEKHFDEISSYRQDWIHVSNRTQNKTDKRRDVFLNMFLDLSSIREEIIYDVSDHTDELEKLAEEYVKIWLPKLSNYREELNENWPKNKGDGEKKKLKHVQQVNDWISEVEGGLVNGVEAAISLSNALEIIKSVSEGGTEYGKNYDVSSLTSVTPLFPEWEPAWNFSILRKFIIDAQKAGKVAEYVCEIKEAYQGQIDMETACLSNDDILYRAEKLLSEHTDILDKIRKQYTKVYVDEFQDTTFIQARIVRMISSKPGTNSESDELEENKLLIVGDPKQSIYRFTGAEKAVYDAFDASMSMSDDLAESVTLDSNFRSERSIVDWVNSTFSKRMPDYSSMNTDWETADEKALHGVFRYKSVQDGSYNKEDDIEAVVKLIEDLTSDPGMYIEVPIRMPNGDFGNAIKRRPCFSDFMIICRKATDMRIYAEALRRHKIPVSVQGKFAVVDDEVVNNFIILMEYLAGYKNEKKQIAAEQVICGFDITKAGMSEREKAAAMLKKLRDTFNENRMDAAAIVQYLLSNEKLFLPRGREFRPERVREYRIRLNQMSEACLNNNDGDLENLITLLKQYRDGIVKREIHLDNSEESVRLMNVHQSKGLTGQIVIIADRSNDEGCRYSGFKKNGKYYPSASYQYIEEGTRIYFPSFGADISVLKQAYKEEMEELARLEYVAATRAAHALIIMPEISKKSWFTDQAFNYESLRDINEWIDERKVNEIISASVPKSKENTKTTISRDTLNSNRIGLDISLINANRLVSISPSQLEATGVSGYSATDPGYEKEARPVGNVFGTVMHRVYELLIEKIAECKDRAELQTEEKIERAVRRAINENIDDIHTSDDAEMFLDYLKSKMSGYYVQVLLPIVNEADEIYPEYSFSLFVDEKDREAFYAKFSVYLKGEGEAMKSFDAPIWINGQADLVVKNKDGSIRVYDYKSDSRNGMPLSEFEESLTKKYQGQLALYRYAIGKAFGVSEVETSLIHLYC